MQKFLFNGKIEWYKAWLVIKSYSQCPGYDYIETFAPTVQMALLHIVLALAAMEDLDVNSIDISNTLIYHLQIFSYSVPYILQL